MHFAWSCYRKNEADGGQSSFVCFRLWGLFSAVGTEVSCLVHLQTSVLKPRFHRLGRKSRFSSLLQRRCDLKRTLWGESAAVKGPRPLRGATGALDLAVYRRSAADGDQCSLPYGNAVTIEESIIRVFR